MESGKSFVLLQASLYSPNDNTISALFSLLLSFRLNDWTGAERVLSAIAKKPEYTVIATIAGALLNGAQKGIPEESKFLLITTAVPLFDKRRFIEACILLHLAGANITAAKYLQESERWEDSVAVAKLYPEEEESLNLIKKAAHHYLDSGNLLSALLLFISIKEYHPALAIMSMMNLRTLAFHVMMFLDKADAIKEYKEDPARFLTQIPELDKLRETIIIKHEKIMK